MSQVVLICCSLFDEEKETCSCFFTEENLRSIEIGNFRSRRSMGSEKLRQTCENEQVRCEKQVKACCYHCSKNLCRSHLLEHFRIVEERNRDELNSLIAVFDNLLVKFEQLNVSSSVVDRPLFLLERWQKQAHEKIDQIVQVKQQKLKDIQHGYKKVFVDKKNESIEEIRTCRKAVERLIEETDGSRQRIDDLYTKIDEFNEKLGSFEEHRIHLLAPLPDLSIEFVKDFSHLSDLFDDELREFRVRFVRLNGQIESHRILSDKDGTIEDLKNSFIVALNASQEVKQPSNGRRLRTKRQIKSDFILPAEIHNNRIHMQYDENHSLSLVLDDDFIVFYELPVSLQEKSKSVDLLPCSFRDSSTKQSLAVPVYLIAENPKSRAEQIIELVQNSLTKVFLFDAQADENLYQINLILLQSGLSKTYRLKDLAGVQIKLNEMNPEIIVDLHPSIGQIYRENNFL